MNRDVILEAAAQIFSQKGYHRASMQDIAEAVNLQKASLYYHIHSKQELLGMTIADLEAIEFLGKVDWEKDQNRHSALAAAGWRLVFTTARQPGSATPRARATEAATWRSLPARATSPASAASSTPAAPARRAGTGRSSSARGRRRSPTTPRTSTSAARPTAGTPTGGGWTRTSCCGFRRSSMSGEPSRQGI